MKFFYHARAGDECIFLDSDEYHYLFRVRRFRDKILAFRNLKDLNIYFGDNKDLLANRCARQGKDRQGDEVRLQNRTPHKRRRRY